MRALNLDVAGEYLLLAATLLHIKSQLLLPNLLRDSDEEDDEDPRLGLVEHLVTYRTYQDAAQLLAARPQLGRDIFTKGIKEDLEKGEMVLGGWEEIELYDLLTAWQRVISRLQPPPFPRDNQRDRYSPREDRRNPGAGKRGRDIEFRRFNDQPIQSSA